MSQKTIKIGIAGARFAAAIHFASYRQLSGIGAEVVGVYSKSRESRESFAGKNGIESFNSYDELVGAVNVVDICVPGALHEPLCVRAAELGRHIIVEKPFTGAYGPGADDWRGNTADKKNCSSRQSGRFNACAVILIPLTPMFFIILLKNKWPACILMLIRFNHAFGVVKVQGCKNQVIC